MTDTVVSIHRPILVTGATGAIGAMVIRELLSRGERPVGLDLSSDFRFMRDVAGRFEFVCGDILDIPLLLDTVKRFGVEGIIHTAALLPDLARANPYRALQVNIMGTANVIEVSRTLGVRRIVFTSTKGVLSDFHGEYTYPTYKPVPEEWPVIGPQNTHTLYNDTKLFCEHYLHKCVEMFGLEVVILRFATIYGPGRVRHGPRAIVSEIVEGAFFGRPVRIPGGGDGKSDYVYIKDVARAVVLAALAPSHRLRHRTFHIGSGEAASLRDFAREVRGLFPKADIEIGPGLDPMGLGFNLEGVMDIRKAREELGYEPRYDVASGVRDYVEFLKGMGS